MQETAVQGSLRGKVWVAGVVVALLLGSGCGYVGVGVALALSSGGGSKKKVPQVAPVILLPDIDRQVGLVTVDYTLQDANADVITMQVEYSPDAGVTFLSATIDSSDEGTIVGDEIQGLTSSAIGVAHTFTWDAPADLGAGANPSVQIRLTPSDGKTTAMPVTSSTFTVGNDAPLVSNPVIQFEDPLILVASGLIGVSYDLEDTTGDLCSILVEYMTSPDGLTWSAPAAATVSVGSLTSLPPGPTGLPATHTLAWNSVADLALNNFPFVQVQITPSDTFDIGSPEATASFEVENNDSPSVFFEPISRQKGAIRIEFVVADPQDDDVQVELFYALSDPATGGTPVPATVIASDGTITPPNIVSGLSSVEGSNIHWIDWDSSTDIGTAAVPAIWFQAIPADLAGMGTTRTAGPFVAGNDAPSVIRIIRPMVLTSQTGIVEIEFELADSTSDPVDLLVEWDDGTGPLPADIAVGITQGAPSAPGGLIQTIAWNTLNDIGVDNRDVTLTITPRDNATALPEIGVPFTMTDVFTVANSSDPIAYIASPIGSQIVEGDVTVSYLLFQPNNATLSITMEYSTDGTSYLSCAERTGPPSEGTTGLSSSAFGDTHVFVWDSPVNLANDAPTVWLRVDVRDVSGAGSLHTMATPFLIDNNDEPTLALGTPDGVQEGNVALRYGIVDVESNAVDITVEFSTLGGAQGTFQPATDAGIASGSDGTTGLSSSADGIDHTFVWNSVVDLVGLGVKNDEVVVRMTPRDHPDPRLGEGPAAQTVAFSVDNTRPPEASGLVPTGISGSIRFDLTIIDFESNIATVAVDFSTDGGTIFEPASVIPPASATTAGSEMTGVSTSPGGVAHFFTWDSAADIGRTNINSIMVRATPRDTKIGVAAVVTLNVLNNDSPVVFISDVTAIQSGNVSINYRLQDTNSDTLNVTVQFRIGGVPLPATQGPGGDPTTGLTSGPPGQEVGHIFVWDSISPVDLSTTYHTNVEIEITASDPFSTGSPATSNIFTVDNSIDADLVLGHQSFLQGAVDGRGIFGAVGIGYGAGKVFVCDAENNRVLILNAVPASDFQTADLVLGQKDFSLDVGWAGGSTTGMRKPSGAWTDGTALYVVDSWSNRVLIWSVMPTADNDLPDLVLGQTTLVGTQVNAGGLSASSLYRPIGISGTATQLFVADTLNNRVLVYDLPILFNKQAATLVLGQADFTSYCRDRGIPLGCGGGSVAGNTLDGPHGLYTDGASLFVADRYNNRVLVWNPLPSVNGQAANRVLGQPNFITESINTGGKSLNSMYRPYDVAGDSAGAGHTYVTDRDNSRVLVWNTDFPASLAAADFALGQTSGSGGLRGASATLLSSPGGIFSTGSQLLIVDQSGNRVKIHDPLPSAFNEAAKFVFGQRDLTGSVENHTDVNAGTLRRLASLETDGVSLFVVDRKNNRVLGWDSLPQVNNKNADFVFGHADFTVRAELPGPASLRDPEGVSYDPFGSPPRLFVADTSHHRVVVYNAPFSAGQAGSAFIGQPDGTSYSGNRGMPNPDSNTLYYPNGLSWDGSFLWVADQFNFRVLRFPSAALVTNGNADMVVGQPDFVSRTLNHGDGDGTRGMNQPRDVVSTGFELLVADTFNHRLLIWSPLPVPTTPDPQASWVLGQTSFSVPGFAGFGRSRFSFPTGVDSDGFRIVVADAENERIMIWDAFPAVNGEPADRMVGQPSFFDSAPNIGGVTARSLYLRAPGAYLGLSPSLDGPDLWVPDSGNNRVLRFPIGP
ncbi:MAG: NHL repeat-containing protein [Planctomycetota bacterium]|nr:NHL repeat-containing protein [Planctomycetota bacterium]